jgi:hypothetical protein
MLVAAPDSAERALGRVLAADGDEIGVARHLIDTLEADSALVSADTLHFCTETVQLILDHGFDYLLCAKGNRLELYRTAKALPWEMIDNARTTCESGHGRDETRTVKTL